MLYRIFQFLFSLTARGYFRSLYVQGKENIPQQGPVIFTPNHTSAFMDPILLATEINRSLYFLARGDVFRHKFIARFLSWIHMIPIYRKDDAPEEMHKNQAVFETCYAHLAKGGTLMIFPEGTSKTERRLRPFKTGTARIALGAEAQNDFSLGIKIVPIGINYSNPHHFRSDVFINFGKPITLQNYQATYTQNAWAAVEDLTQNIKAELEKRVIIVDDERLDGLVRQIEVLYRSKLRETQKNSDKAPQDFYLSKDIAKAVAYHIQKNPERVGDFENRITSYLKALKRLGIRDTQVRNAHIEFNLLWTTFYFIIGFPLFLFGFAVNVIPFMLADYLVRYANIREDFVGSIRLAGSMIIFSLLYLVQASLVGLFYDSFWVAFIFICSLYPAGLFTLGYLKRFFQIRGSFRYLQLFLKKSDFIARLKITRNALVDILEQGRAEYLASINANGEE